MSFGQLPSCSLVLTWTQYYEDQIEVRVCGPRACHNPPFRYTMKQWNGYAKSVYLGVYSD